MKKSVMVHMHRVYDMMSRGFTYDSDREMTECGNSQLYFAMITIDDEVENKRMNDEEIDLKVKIYSQTPIKMNRHVTVYPSIQECLEYKQRLIDQAKNVKE